MYVYSLATERQYEFREKKNLCMKVIIFGVCLELLDVVPVYYVVN